MGKMTNLNQPGWLRRAVTIAVGDLVLIPVDENREHGYATATVEDMTHPPGSLALVHVAFNHPTKGRQHKKYLPHAILDHTHALAAKIAGEIPADVRVHTWTDEPP